MEEDPDILWAVELVRGMGEARIRWSEDPTCPQDLVEIERRRGDRLLFICSVMERLQQAHVK